MKTLYNYDENNKKYIEFKYENVNEYNITYHGYHVGDIPPPIKKRLEEKFNI